MVGMPVAHKYFLLDSWLNEDFPFYTGWLLLISRIANLLTKHWNLTSLSLVEIVWWLNKQGQEEMFVTTQVVVEMAGTVVANLGFNGGHMDVDVDVKVTVDVDVAEDDLLPANQVSLQLALVCELPYILV